MSVQLGQEMEFRILRIDAENKKIGLSARAVSSDDPIVETKDLHIGSRRRDGFSGRTCGLF
jgi:ribosomal protein S1